MSRNLITPETIKANENGKQGGYTYHCLVDPSYTGIVITMACLRLGDHAHVAVYTGSQTAAHDWKPWEASSQHRSKAGNLIMRWPEWVLLRNTLDETAPYCRIAEVENPTAEQLIYHEDN